MSRRRFPLLNICHRKRRLERSKRHSPEAVPTRRWQAKLFLTFCVPQALWQAPHLHLRSASKTLSLLENAMLLISVIGRLRDREHALVHRQREVVEVKPGANERYLSQRSRTNRAFILGLTSLLPRQKCSRIMQHTLMHLKTMLKCLIEVCEGVALQDVRRHQFLRIQFLSEIIWIPVLVGTYPECFCMLHDEV